MLQKDFIASGTSGVHFVLSTSVRSKRNISACCGTFVSDMCTLGCTGSICTLFCNFPSHLWEKEGIASIMNFMILQHPLFMQNEKSNFDKNMGDFLQPWKNLMILCYNAVIFKGGVSQWIRELLQRGTRFQIRVKRRIQYMYPLDEF